MTKEQIIKIRKQLHNLPGKERGMMLPISILGANTNYVWSEADSCFMWDDDNEILYIVMPNNTYNSVDNRLYPMQVKTICYNEITVMSAPVDRLCLDRFMEDMVDRGLTNEETRKRYFEDMTKLFDLNTYAMGDPSPTTEKRGLKPDDEIINQNSTKFL